LGVRFESESEMPMTPPITFPDSNRHSVELLQLALERQDTANLPVLSMAVCRNAYDHLFYFFNARTKENGAAMSSLLIAQGELARAQAHTTPLKRFGQKKGDANKQFKKGDK
jgi:hypothetical protein